jgi:hypothetical protein
MEPVCPYCHDRLSIGDPARVRTTYVDHEGGIVRTTNGEEYHADCFRAMCREVLDASDAREATRQEDLDARHIAAVELQANALDRLASAAGQLLKLIEDEIAADEAAR